MLPRMRREALTHEFIVAGRSVRSTGGWVLDLSLKPVLKIGVSVPDSAMPQWKPLCAVKRLPRAPAFRTAVPPNREWW